MANYDNLSAAQQAEFDRLMVMKMSDWPTALHDHIQNNGPIYTGDHLADVMAGWVRQEMT